MAKVGRYRERKAIKALKKLRRNPKPRMIVPTRARKQLKRR